MIPLTMEEVTTAVMKQYERDELQALQLLESLNSESAEIITKLSLTREAIKLALMVLKDNHKAQINLMNIICGTRFKYHFHGVLVPTRCPNKYHGRKCNETDSLEHLLRCYGLQKIDREGPMIVEFLTIMATRTITEEPGKPAPMYICKN